jgi:hypothetical protein
MCVEIKTAPRMAMPLECQASVLVPPHDHVGDKGSRRQNGRHDGHRQKIVQYPEPALHGELDARRLCCEYIHFARLLLRFREFLPYILPQKNRKIK